MKDDANIFKLIGPALVKQDKVEAQSNVEKRLEYIRGEMYVVYYSLTIVYRYSMYAQGIGKMLWVDVFVLYKALFRSRVESQLKELNEKENKKRLDVRQISYGWYLTIWYKVINLSTEVLVLYNYNKNRKQINITWQQ